MKNFVCSNCGNTVKRPSAPLKCDACGQQRVGLFKSADGPSKPSMNIAPPPPPLGASTPPAARPSTPAPPRPATPSKPVAPPFVPPPVKPQAPAAKAPSAPPAPSRPASTPAPAKPASTSRAAGYRLDDDDDDGPPSAPSRSAAPGSRAPTSTARSTAPSQGYAAESTPARKTTPAPQTTATPDGPGSIAWRYPEWLPGQGVALAALRNCPAADGQGRIFAAVGSIVAGLVEEGGQLQVLWEYKTGGHIPGSPSLGPDGRVRVHSNDGKLHCVTDAGQAAWTPTSVGEPLGWASPLVDTDDYTWLCAYGGGLLKVDPRGIKGNPAYFRSRQKFDSTGLIHDGVFYVGSEDGFVYAVDVKGHKGKLAWDPLTGQGKTDWFINSAPAMGGGALVAGRDEHLYAFRFEGTQLWELHLRGQMLASPVVDDQGEIYVCVSLERRGEPAQGKLVCVTGDPPRIRWEYRAEGAVESTPVIGSDGVIYFGDNAGIVHAVNRDGRAEWTQSVGSAVRSAGTIPMAGRVVFGNDEGQLVALLCSSEGIPDRGWPKYMCNLAQRSARS